MILTDREIRIALEERQILMEPAPDSNSFSSTSLDLTLEAPIQIWRPRSDPKVVGVETSPEVFSPGAPGFAVAAVLKRFTDMRTIPPEGFVLEPLRFFLAWTRERVELPITSRLAARVEGKSSLARLGIGIHVTAPTIHAGFKGQIQLEVFNHGPLHVRLLPAMKVCQLIFEQTLGVPEKGYRGAFFAQTA